ncbi:MAG: tRNA adenosine(34) deaminase TadA [Polyangiaceae bacterium]
MDTSWSPDLDVLLMREALREGEVAAAKGEVPVGAIVAAADGQIVARGHNLRETTHDPTAHAEVIALREASRVLERFRLSDLTLYVTLEPCAMCAGALVLARVKRVVYGCKDPKAGAVDTHFGIGLSEKLNHRFELCSGILEDECRAQLQTFFASLRAARRPRPDAP